MIDFLSQPWPWYVAGPLIGLMVPLLALYSGKAFGISSSLRHTCAATVPGRSAYLRYDWRRQGLWNLTFAVGILAGGALARLFFASPEPIAVAASTRADLARLGITRISGLVPPEVYSLEALQTPGGWLVLVVGGFLVGFGARYAGGCTSGHGVTGLAGFQLGSLAAVLGFFAGGLVATHVLLPLVLGGGW